MILGASWVDQLLDTLAAVDMKIEPNRKKQLDDVTIEYRRGYPAPMRGFGMFDCLYGLSGEESREGVAVERQIAGHGKWSLV